MTATRSIAIVRALGGLGDFLCAVPALRALRQGHPEARIDYIGLPAIEGVAGRYGALIDRFVTFPGFPGIVEYPFALPRLQDYLGEVRAAPRYDLAIQMHGSGSVSNVFTALLGAKKMAGFHLPGLWVPDPECFFEYPTDRAEPLRWLALMALIGLDADDPMLSFPIEAADRRALAAVDGVPEAGRYAVLHAGASDPRRRWPPERFAAIGDELSARGLAVVLTGTHGEEPMVEAVAAAMAAPAVNLCGRTTLGAAAALIEEARLVVTNDTGTSHLAAAIGTPSVAIFIASDPARWAPVNRLRHGVAGEGVADPAFGATPVTVPGRVPEVAEVRGEVDALMLVAA